MGSARGQKPNLKEKQPNHRLIFVVPHPIESSVKRELNEATSIIQKRPSQ